MSDPDLLLPPEEHPAPTVNVTATPEAIEKLKAAIANCNRGQDDELSSAVGVRLGVRGGGCSGFEYAPMQLVTGKPADTDFVIDCGGVKFFVDQMSAMYLDGVEITYDQFTGFNVTNPNANRHCGCGKSFSN